MKSRYQPSEILEGRRLLAFGALDASFGNHGVATASEGSTHSAAIDVLPDGRIITARVVDRNSDGPASLWVTRLLPDGTPDPNFGGTRNGQPAGTPRGTVRVNGNRLPNDVVDLRVTKQGKIILCGTFEGGGGENGGGDQASSGDLTVVRLNRDGTRDDTFGGASRGHGGASPGVAFVDFGESNDFARALAVAADGRIAVVGTSRQPQQLIPTTSGVAAVFRTDGSFDETFNGTGKSIWAMGQQSPRATVGHAVEAAAFGQSGELVVAAPRAAQSIEAPVRHDWEFHSIGANGLTHAMNPFTSGDAHASQGVSGTAKDVAVLADGSVLVAGESGGALVVAKVLADGTLDRAFGDNGLSSAALPNDSAAPVAAESGRVIAARIAMLPDGRFYVLGQIAAVGADRAETHSAFVARFTSGGASDPGFGGTHRIDTGAEFHAADLAIHGDDAIVLAAVTPGGPEADGDVAVQIRKLQGGAGSRLSKAGTLEVSGTSTGDTINVTRRTKDGRMLVRVNTHVRSYAPSRVKRIQIYAQGGNDTVTIGKDIRGTFIDAGPGRDNVTGGDGNDTIVGGPGSDRLVGGNGNDILSGGGGKDYLLGSAGHDKLCGGAGVDTLNGAGGNDLLSGGGDGAADSLLGGSGADKAAGNLLDFVKDIEHFLATVAD